MVVEERLTSTLCNRTTSPLKNSALFFCVIFSARIYLISILYRFPTCVYQQARGWKASSPTIGPHGGRVRYTPGYHIPQIRLLARNPQMGHGYLRRQRVFQLCLHGILLLRNAVLDGRRCCATRHSTPPVQHPRQMERARLSQEYTIRTSNVSC